MLPNFLVIGSPKCGTTWIYDVLKEHPEVYVNSEIKETFFFDYQYDKGLDWYSNFFEKYDGQKCVGEIASTYFRCSEAPNRIKRDLGDIKLICVLRNPIKAAYSQYLHWFRDGSVGEDFIEATKQKPNILEGYLYAKHLNNYLNYFDRTNLYFMLFEELKNDSENYYRKLCDILDINSKFIPEVVYKKSNVRKYPRLLFLNKLVYKVWKFVMHNDLHFILKLARKLSLKQLFFSEKEPSGLEFKEEYKKFLISYYKDDIKELSNLLDKDFSHWFDI